MVNDGWRQPRQVPSLAESYQTVPVPKHWPWWRKLLAFAGPGYVIAVGYMDPGNWATDLAGGSAFGYSLLSVIFLSNLIAILLQSLSGKLGIATGRDLAQACRDHFSYPVSVGLWILCEIAICACDLSEVLGSAIALKLLFNIPITLGVVVTAIDVFIVMYFQKISFRFLEGIIIFLMMIIATCFSLELFFSNPDMRSLFSYLIPTVDILYNKEMLFVSIGIIGATVMPHNLYLHSSIVQTRKYGDDAESRRMAIKYITWDSTIALVIAFVINAAILIMAAAVFHQKGYTTIAEIQDAYQLLTPLLNAPLASTLFAIALLAAGQNSTLTGTLAGQIIMEGFLNLRLRPWVRRLITRGLAIIPAILCILYFGEHSVSTLLLLSQVILSFQLGFAIIPLILFTSDRRKMGEHVNALWITILAWVSALFIIGLNIKLFMDMITQGFFYV